MINIQLTIGPYTITPHDAPDGRPFLGIERFDGRRRTVDVAELFSFGADPETRPLVGMTADDISLILKTAADAIDTMKAWLPPEICDKLEQVIRLIEMIFLPVMASDSPGERTMAAGEFSRQFAAVGITKEQLESIRRLVHDAGEFQKTGDAERTQKVMRGIASGWFLRRLAAWLVG